MHVPYIPDWFHHREKLKMLRKSRFWCLAAISLCCEAIAFGPALAADCGYYGCDSKAVVQPKIGIYRKAAPAYGYRPSYLVYSGGYPAVISQYCDGFGGGQWPYGCCPRQLGY